MGQVRGSTKVQPPMDLILWRHAEANEGKPNEDDLARTLTLRGERHAAKMAGWLNRILPDTVRVLVSPAQCAWQTAGLLCRKVRVLDALAPGATPMQLLAAARWPENREPVLLVGHQPSLGQLVAYLMGGVAPTNGPAVAIQKGSVWWLRHRVRHGVPEVALVSVHSPDQL